MKNYIKLQFPKEIPASDLKKIPSVGANMEKHLHNIGIRCIADLRGKSPEELYHLETLNAVEEVQDTNLGKGCLCLPNRMVQLRRMRWILFWTAGL